MAYALPLLEAIKSFFLTDASALTLRQNLGNRIFMGRAPDSTVYPFLELSIPASDTDDTFTTSHDTPTVDFGLWDNQRSPKRVLQRAEELEAVFRDVKLTVSGFNNLRAEKVSGFPIEEPGAKGWHYVMSIDYWLQKL